MYAVTDVLCVNETELQMLAGVTAADGDLEGYKKAAEACVRNVLPVIWLISVPILSASCASLGYCMMRVILALAVVGCSCGAWAVCL